MKKLYYLLLFLNITAIGYAQQQPNFLFFEQNMSTINPAFTGSEGQLLGLNYRSSWAGIQDAPRAATLVYNTAERNNASWGFNYVTDRVYVENQGIVAVDYSYKLVLSEDMKLYLGIKGGGLYNNIDLSKLNRITNEPNEALSGIDNYMNPLLGIGAYLKTKNMFLGISTPNLLNSKRFKEVNGIATTATDKPHFYLAGGFQLKLTDFLQLEPSVLYRAVSAAPNQVTAIAKLNLKDQVSAGVGVSNNDYISAMVLFHGMQNMSIGYGYEMGQRTSSTALRANTHEVVFRYQFGNND